MSYIKVEDLSLGYDSEIVCSNINFEINIFFLKYMNFIKDI